MVRDAAPVIAFYTDVFEAVPIERECLLDGRVLHAELAVGGHRLAVSEWYDGPGAVAADGPVVLTVAPDDPQLLLKRALAAGAELEAAADGAVDAVFRDPAGQRWSVVGASRPE
ncbi:VOC family protein [Micromonospora halophytica]|nr:VOC family protein [Micromonospora halophytica]